jgi:hypothetical protein
MESPAPKDRPAAAVPGRWPERLVADLAELLASPRGLYLSLGPKGAVMAVKWPQAHAFGEARVGRWHRLTPRRRAEALLEWIERAADYCRKPRIRRFCWMEDTAV